MRGFLKAIVARYWHWRVTAPHRYLTSQMFAHRASAVGREATVLPRIHRQKAVSEIPIPGSGGSSLIALDPIQPFAAAGCTGCFALITDPLASYRASIVANIDGQTCSVLNPSITP